MTISKYPILLFLLFTLYGSAGETGQSKDAPAGTAGPNVTESKPLPPTGRTALTGTETFIDFGVTGGFGEGTAVTDQFQNLGVIFSGADGGPAHIVSDGSSDTSPVLSGTQSGFMGPITATFVDPTTGEPTTMGRAGARFVGFFNNVNSTRMRAFDLEGNIIATVINRGLGFEYMSVGRTTAEIAALEFTTVSEEKFGFAIDHFVFSPQPETPASAANYRHSAEHGDPVNTFTGEFTLQEGLDINLGGFMPLFLNRFYGSGLDAVGVTGAMGPNWRHNFQWDLVFDDHTATVTTPAGRLVRLNRSTGYTIDSEVDIPFVIAIGAGGNLEMFDPRSRFTYEFELDTQAQTGRLIRIHDHQRLAINALDLSYHENGDLGSVSDGIGRTLTFTHVGGKLTAVSDGTRSVSYTYAGDDLVTFTDLGGGVTNYSYQSPGLMATKTLPRGNTPFTNVYDSQGRVLSQTDAEGNTTTFDYQPVSGGSLTTMVDPDDSETEHEHNTIGRVTRLQSGNAGNAEITYDELGRRDGVIDDMGNGTRVTRHFPSGMPERVETPDGGVTEYRYERQTGTSINDYLVDQITYPDGTSQSMIWGQVGNLFSQTDQAGNTTTFANLRGQIQRITNPAGGVTRTSHNSDQTMATSRGPDNNIVRYAYDSLKRLETITFADNTTRLFAYDDRDSLISFTDEASFTSTMTYDANGNLAGDTDAAGAVTTYTYDGMDRLLTSSNPLGGLTSYSYDEMGRLATETDLRGHTTSYQYDAIGNMIAMTDGEGELWTRSFDAEGVLTSETNPLGQTTTYESDHMGRIVGVTNALGQRTSYQYDIMGRISAITDPRGEVVTHGFDVRGLREQTANPLFSTRVVRNVLGNITQFTDANGNNYSRDYDNGGRILSATDPLSRQTTYGYDVRNRINAFTYPDGTTLEQTFDGVGNVSRRTYSDGLVLDYTHDGMGRLLTAQSLAMSYDLNGLIDSCNGLAVSRDSSGLITSILLEPGRAVNYTAYDGNNRILTMTDWLGATLGFTYDAAGRLIAISRPNGVNTSYTYNSAGRVRRIDEGGHSIRLAYDAAGNIISRQTDLPVSGNPADLALDAVTVDAASQLSSAVYDQRGRTAADALRTYDWGVARLEGYQQNGATVSFTYDGLGYRTSRQASGITQTITWNYAFGIPAPSVIAQTGGPDYYYIHSPDGLLLYRINAQTNGRHWYHYDEMGNTLFLTDDSGAVIAGYAYGPYGEPLAETGDSDNPFTWQGQFSVFRETADGLYYQRARYYDSTYGRFISKDPIQSLEPKQANPYQFALANPLRYIDPLGLSPHPPGGTPSHCNCRRTPKKMLIIVDTDKNDGIPEMAAYYMSQVRERGYVPVRVSGSDVAHNQDNLEIPYGDIYGVLTIGHSSSSTVAGSVSQRKLLDLLRRIANSRNKGSANLDVLAFWGCESAKFYDKQRVSFLSHVNRKRGAVFAYRSKVANNAFKQGFGRLDDDFLDHLEDPDPGEWEYRDILGTIVGALPGQ